MKIYSKKITFFSLSFFIITLFPHQFGLAQSTNNKTVIITEVSAAVSSDEEWIEIYNSGDEPLAIDSLTLFENETNHHITSLQEDNTHIPAQGIAIIANKADIFLSYHPNYVGQLLDSSWSSLRETGELLALKKGDEIFDNTTYNEHDKDQTSERIGLGDEWEIGQNTPGNISEKQRAFIHPAAVLTETDSSETAIEPPIPQTNLEIDSIPPQEVNSLPSTTEDSSESHEPSNETPLQIKNTEEPSTEPNTDSHSSIEIESKNNNQPIYTYTTIVSNAAPVALIKIQSGLLEGIGKVSINFDGRNSYDPNGDTLMFEWDFGDGTKADTANPGIHHYIQPGNYPVQLMVSDRGGLRGYAYEHVSVLAEEKKVPITKITQSSSINSPVKAISTSPTTALSVGDIEKLIASYLSNSTYGEKIHRSETSQSGLSQNKIHTLPPPGTIRINELFPAPAQGEPEWIELYNTSRTAVSLSEWLIGDEAKAKNPYVFPTGSVIPPQGFIVLKNDESKISLNNNQDSLYLGYPDGRVADSVHFTGGLKIHSYARTTQDGEDIDKWFWTSDATLGTTNKKLTYIEGVVEKIDRVSNGKRSKQAILIREKDDTIKAVTIDDQDPTGDISHAFFEPGTEVAFAAYEGSDNSMQLAEIDTVQKPLYTASELSNQTGEGTKVMFLYIIGGFLLLNIAATGYILYMQKQNATVSDEIIIH